MVILRKEVTRKTPFLHDLTASARGVTALLDPSDIICQLFAIIRKSIKDSLSTRPQADYGASGKHLFFFVKGSGFATFNYHISKGPIERKEDFSQITAFCSI